MAHATISSIDADEARGASGVIAVFTAADIDLAPRPPGIPRLNMAMTRPWLATDRVRFVGEPVVAIVSESREQGVDAAELVLIDYDPLPVIVDPEAAEQSEVQLFPDVGTNVAMDIGAMMGFSPAPDFIDGCDVVVRQRIVNTRVAPCPMEVRAAAARWGEDGRLTQWASTQNPHSLRDSLAEVYGVEGSQVRVIAPDVGGG